MKKDRTRLIIGVLLSLLLFSSSLGLWFYIQEQGMNKKLQNMKYVYVLTHDVKKNTKLSDSDIKLERYPKEVIHWKLLSKAQILHKYAKTDLYAGEPVMASKLSDAPLIQKKKTNVAALEPKKPIEKKIKISFQGDSITLPLHSFQNIDPTLRSGNKVDILAIDASVNDLRNEKKLKTRYAAIGVKVVSFGYGPTQYKSVTKKVTQGNKTKTILADTITLAVTPKNVKNLLALYYKTKSFNSQRAYNESNKGHLWLVRNRTTDEKTAKEKEKLLLDYTKRYSHRKQPKRAQSIRIEYEK